MRYLHTMVRVRDLDASLRFYCEGLGLRETRRKVSEQGKYTLVFVAANDSPEAEIELTYNWDSSEDYGGARNFGDMKVLRRYERWRRSENLLAGAGLDALERLFSYASGPIPAARRFGLGAVERLPMLKRRLARQALGLGGDLPAIIKQAG